MIIYTHVWWTTWVAVVGGYPIGEEPTGVYPEGYCIRGNSAYILTLCGIASYRVKTTSYGITGVQAHRASH
jgi:hypothetical protein